MDLPNGIQHHNNSTGRPEAFSTIFNRWLEMGKSQEGEGTTTIPAGTKVEVTARSVNDRVHGWDWDPIPSTGGDDWALTETREANANGNDGFYLENTGTTDVDVKWILWMGEPA